MSDPVSLTKTYAGSDWLAERALEQERRDERDYFERGSRLVWGDPIQAWHPDRVDVVDAPDLVYGDLAYLEDTCDETAAIAELGR